MVDLHIHQEQVDPIGDSMVSLLPLPTSAPLPELSPQVYSSSNRRLVRPIASLLRLLRCARYGVVIALMLIPSRHCYRREAPRREGLGASSHEESEARRGRRGRRGRIGSRGREDEKEL